MNEAFPDRARILAETPTGVFIDGAWRDADAGRRFPVEDPATEERIAEVADGRPSDGMAALDAACRAQAEWAATPPRTRSELLRRGFEAMQSRAEDLATLMTSEMGKPLAEARAEVAYAAEFLRWFAEEAPRIGGRYATAPDGRNRLLVLRRPVGPSLLITPWNFPLAMAARKVAPAIAAGCTMVLKPAALTPLSALAFTQIMHDAGLPPGVLNVVPTSTADAVVSPLLDDGRLRKLSFTGSTEVGRALLASASDQVLRTSMELGGNAPLLVFADADLDLAVAGAVQAKMRNGGEACTAANRILVERPVYEEFVDRLATELAAFRLGHGLDSATTLGPMVDEATVGKIEELVDDAVAGGARVVTGGRRRPAPGHFFEPTVLADVPSSARLLREEIFGPVAPVIPFDGESEAVRMANDTPFGLVAYAFTSDLDRGLRLAETLEVGMLGLNAGVISNPAAPFGGVKHSGLGREGGAEGIEEYLDTRYVGIADPMRAG